MTRAEFLELVERLGNAWTAGDARAAADCFADAADYADPLRYRFRSREALVPFFEPPPGGHSTTWHRVLFDEASQAGAVEYTYTGHHRYHGAAVVEIDEGGRISRWREWQHLDDGRDWRAFLASTGLPSVDTGS